MLQSCIAGYNIMLEYDILIILSSLILWEERGLDEGLYQCRLFWF